MARKKRHNEIDWTDDEEEIIWVSKSEIKRDAEHLKKLGESLINLTPSNLAKIPLDDNLRDAIELAQRLRLEARRRQIQYVGKLLRNLDPEPIQEALDKVENRHNQQLALLQKLEQTRDQLIEQGDAAVNSLVDEYPNLDRQHLRNLVRMAQKEKAANKPPKNYREIFQYLKSMIVEQ
ncbi:MAG: ribosome biogenesis factor YjgA [Pasteurellaceae bacterium]|nr:ribosome biogenesis factor YjgA [Pasteurellaceae bacterium]